MKGLIIKEPWLNLIFEGVKTWEIRGNAAKIRGRIALIQSGTKCIYGYADLEDVLQLDQTTFVANVDKHHVQTNELPYQKTHAWILGNVTKLETPIPYVHPQGAIIWVNLP